MAKEESDEFDDTFNRIISKIIPEITIDGLKDSYDRIKRIIRYNVPHGKRNRGLAVVDTFRLIAEQQNRKPTDDEMELSRVLGWIVEFLQAYFIMVDDMMDQSITRRGRLCWYKLDDVRLMANNDAVIIDNETYHILKIYFSDKPYYTNIFDLMHRIALLSTYGQNMDTASNPPKKGPQFDIFSKERYDNIIKYKTAYYSFVLPVRLAMFMSSIDSKEDHSIAEEILLEIGQLFQAQDDCLDVWGDPDLIGKIGTDIVEGKCSWPIVTAFKLCTKEQRDILVENYGKKEENCVKKVKEIYNQLNLKQMFEREEEQIYKEICELIGKRLENSSLNTKIFRQFLDKIYKRKK